MLTPQTTLKARLSPLLLPSFGRGSSYGPLGMLASLDRNLGLLVFKTIFPRLYP